jgi:hypothetical protein
MRVSMNDNRNAKRRPFSDDDTAPVVGDDHRAGLRLKSAYAEQAGAQERALLIWSSFAVTFGLTRALTVWIHAGHGPKGGMSGGGRHFHHYNIALRGRDRHRRHPVTAAAYGSGATLILDEAALLIDLQDVYWAHDGRKMRRSA